MKVGIGGGVARVSVAETITALWTFANANGIALDDIIERTAAAGVTIDGVTLRDITVELLGLASSAGIVLQSDVTGDTVRRFVLRADGGMEWGSGAGARDVNLVRVIANVLGTNDSFQVAGVSGLIADDITERTASAGVTVDGLLVKDSSVRALGLALASTVAMMCDVVGDSQQRYRVNADGETQWGPGNAARDTTLQRDAAGELGTPDDFNVGGVLDLAGDLEVADQTTVLVAGTNNNVATGIVTVQRLDADTNGANLITGFAGGRAHRVILVMNIGTTDSPTLAHESVSSVAANRLLLPLEANRTLSTSGGAWFIYDPAVSRWRMVRTI